MKDELVKFDTAQLAKQKGFNLFVKSYYRITQSGPFEEPSNHNWNDDIKMETVGGMTYVSAPTQSLLQRWLREVHGIDIIIFPILTLVSKQKCYYSVLYDKAVEEIGNWQDVYGDVLEKATQDIPGDYLNDELHDKFLLEDEFAHDSYEEALEVGLQKALELI